MGSVNERRQARRQAAGSYEPTPEERADLEVIKERFRPDDADRMALEQRWLTNIAFYSGYQYFSWDPIQRQLVYREPVSQRWRSRLAFNIVRPNVRQLVSMLGSFRPAFKVRPATSDAEDIQSANVGKKVATHYWDYLQMPEKRWDILNHLELFGNAFIKLCFNPRGGDPIYNELPGTDGASAASVDIEYDGEMESEIPTPFCIYVDPFCETPESLRWLIDCRARPIEWVEQNFPDKAAFIPPEIEEGSGGSRRWSMRLNSQSGAYGSLDGDRKKDWVLVKEYWEVPSMDYPRGRLIIEANGIILRSGDNPTPKGKIPYVWIRNEIVPGSVWAETPIDDLLPVQRATNRMLNKKIEHVVNTANAKALEHTGNALPESAWSTDNEVIKWSGTNPPGWLAPPPLSNDVSDVLGDLGMFADRVTSNYGPARGQYQGKVSGRAYLALIEQDINTKSPVIDRLTIAFSRWASLLLEWVRVYVIEQRLVKIVGRGESFDIMEFTGSDIGDNTDVTIDIDSMMPKSKAMGLELLASLAPGEKWLSAANPDDRAKVFRSLGMDDGERIIQDKRLDEREAMLENKQMFLGKIIEPARSIEDQDVHFMIHTDAMKTDEYKSLSPLHKMIFESHLQTHRNIITPQIGVTLPPGAMEETSMEGPPPRQGRGGGGGGGGSPPQQNQIKPFS